MEGLLISARSRRQAMDWSLVLASQEIHAVILGPDQESSWGLLVEPEQHARAVEAIRLYQAENRGWRWRQALPWAGEWFHWGGLAWCLFLAFFYRLSMVERPALRSLLMFDSKAASDGEWWRFFTSILLHGDLAHLAANFTTGFLLFGLAMAQFGAGLGLLTTFIAGALGNGLGWMLYPQPYRGWGASGMVMGALGLLSVHTFFRWRTGRVPRHYWTRGLAGGILLFVLLGTDPSSDVLAHVGGFLGGTILGVLAMRLPPRWKQNSTFQWLCGSAFFLLLCAALAAALIASS